MICPKDTWAFLVEQSLRHAHFRLPDRITDTDDGQIDTRLSSRSLLVTTPHILDQPATDDLAAWALAHAINQRTREAVTAASSAPEGRSGDTHRRHHHRPGRPPLPQPGLNTAEPGDREERTGTGTFPGCSFESRLARGRYRPDRRSFALQRPHALRAGADPQGPRRRGR
ncbi:hypothetical protein [Streptomyces achromogenes]|uniref:hypothetical protein n=1 Tax=Streptomyces achromogenes TaxID=67255 RepID=UPI0027D88DB5|nr:hypothetical protein [Streptomyces achromogenes]